LGALWGGNALMLLGHDALRVALLTDHIPLHKVTAAITVDLITQKTKQLNQTLENDFGCQMPKIALLGLNPHAGDQGVIGNEDDAILKPAIAALKKEGVEISGPFAADGFFGQKSYRNFDAVLSCYHDQGLVGFKALAFGQGVNVTTGLPFVRTPPDHGTAFDIAGKGVASHVSFAAALQMASAIYNNRQKTD
jgi:4-hydroxythreonine-4-phosphate dehydrogenase